MYPGYSPGDIEYGKASEDYGKYAVDAKKNGIDSKLSEEYGKYTVDAKKKGIDSKPSEQYGKYFADTKKKGVDSKPDIEYGKHTVDAKKKGIYTNPSEEYGDHAVDAMKKGIDTKPEGPEYKVGQSKSHSRLTLAQMQALKDFQDRPKSSPAKDTNGASSEAKKTGHKGKGQGSAKASSKDANPVFFTDTTPTPINLPSSSKKQKPTAEKKDGKKSKYTRTPEHPTPEPRRSGLFPPHPDGGHPFGPPPKGDPYLIPKQDDIEAELDRLGAIHRIKLRIREEEGAAEFKRCQNFKKRRHESDSSFESFLNPASNEQPKGKKVRIVADEGTEAGTGTPKKRAADEPAGEKKVKKAKDGKDGKEDGEEKPAKKRKEKDGESKKAKDGKEDGEGKPVKKRKGKDGEGKVVADSDAKDEKKRLVDTDIPDVAENKEEGKKKRRKVVA